jgi:prokaryotic ubiquitin-like protein Pup
MASGDQTRKPKPKRDEEATQADAKKAESTTAEETDELLDEIDSVLEVNAEEFVRSYVQKGGE